MRTLDRSKPFGQVFGGHGHSFEQDGTLFDHEGKEVGGKAKAVPAKSADEPAKKPSEPIKATHKLGDRNVVLADMDVGQLRAAAVEAGVKVHHNAGEAKLREALAEALPLGDADQVDSQLEQD
jgi:hypothetical protein